ncbi:regulatory protein RecX [Tissierellia bacterium KA00581]|nr:regulatory protein RecX [Tissierellia bacterium KA00581]
MKVKKIEFDKKREVFKVSFEDENELLVNYETFEKYKISLDTDFTLNEVLEMKYFSDIERAKLKAIKFVLGKFKTKMEVRKKLNKEFDNDIIDEVLNFLEKNSYVDDRNYAIYFIEDKQKLNGYGKNKIKSLLIQKGISKQIIDEFIFDEDNEFENALKMGIKKLNLLKNEENRFKKKQKIINYLAYRGFSFDIIQKVLGEIL